MLGGTETLADALTLGDLVWLGDIIFDGLAPAGTDGDLTGDTEEGLLISEGDTLGLGDIAGLVGLDRPFGIIGLAEPFKVAELFGMLA